MSLVQKVKDRDDELRGKAGLLSVGSSVSQCLWSSATYTFKNIHDEVFSLNLQLNMSEQAQKKLKAENEELIDRWMAYKSKEAEAMNNTLR